MSKRAVLIGINDYDSTEIKNLSGCVNDVIALVPFLTNNEDNSPNFECKQLLSSSARVTRASILSAINELLAPGATLGLLYFAGHGYATDSDVILVAQDGEGEELGVPFSAILTKIRTSLVGEVMVILDCCYSGGASGVPQLGGNMAVLRSGVSILTASRGDQTAEESASASSRGIFSTYLCGALDGGAADVLGKITLAGIYAYLSESFGAFSARPTFKANVEQLHEVRLCDPAVPKQDLRKLKEIFPTRDFVLALDRTYEPREDPKGHPNEAIFAILQKCRAAKLVEPVGTEHMYDAAMEGLDCRLTPLGKHYWNLSKSNRIR
jgi:uncharacterized caspase-like protein